MKTAFLSMLLCTATMAFGAASQAGAWSDAVDGIRGRLSIDHAPDFNGAEILVVFLEFQNTSDTGNPRRVWFAPGGGQFKWELLDGDGSRIPESASFASIMIPPAYWITLPYDSTLRFRVSVSGYGIGRGGFVLQLGRFWQIQRKPGSRYFLNATFSSSAPKEEESKAEWIGEFWKGTITLPAIEIPEQRGPNQAVTPMSAVGARGSP
jgi:hypothetical protein